jgi:hypothetical protein
MYRVVVCGRHLFRRRRQGHRRAWRLSIIGYRASQDAMMTPSDANLRLGNAIAIDAKAWTP